MKILAIFFDIQNPMLAQINNGSGGTLALVFALVLIGIFLVLMIYSEKSNKAKKTNVNGREIIVLKKGHDIRLKGAVESNNLIQGKVTRVAIMPTNFIGMSPIPKMLVEVGDEVKAGDPLFFDKKNDRIKFCAPVSGEVVAVERGEKRSISKVIILADKELKFRDLPAIQLNESSRSQLVDYLCENGLWPLLRQRPFNTIPDPTDMPRDIFVSTFDSAPLAPDYQFIAKGKGAALQKGIDVLAKLTSGKVYLGLNHDVEMATEFTSLVGVEQKWFSGKHPVGNVGVQIHHIQPLAANEKVWTIGVQELISLGESMLNQRLDLSRIVAVVGSEIEKPVYVKTYLGANIGDLVNDNLEDEHKIRIISGDVLSGQKKETDDFVNFFDDQLTAIREGDYYEMFGWLIPGKSRPTVSRSFLNYFTDKHKQYTADTNNHGEERAFVVTGQYEDLLPMDIYPQHILKSILIGDIEKMEKLGIHELVEEDLALCEFSCTSKQPLQEILRNGLEMMREQQ
jgi:Na+-transporting NADH:ubiquinone oxidoreductase subunit A